MKPVEITEEEYRNICHALSRKAAELGNYHIPLTRYFSQALYPSVYAGGPPKAFRSDYPREKGLHLYHFMPYDCACSEHARMKSPTEVICIGCQRNAKPLPIFYLTTHRIGRCPWKTRKEG